jgi:hypothetical protein
MSNVRPHMSTDAEIIETVAIAFSEVAKPQHFTNHLHCEECEEHDKTLLEHDRSSLQVDAVNNPGWDPICFCSPEGKAYYMPTLIRFALANADAGALSYWQQLLFHLEGDGPNNALIAYCSKPQRRAIAMFLEHLVESRAAAIEEFGSTDEVLRTHSYWAASAA